MVELKGIIQPVHFRIFFSDFVTPKKRTMSENDFKNDSAIYREQGFYLQVISAKWEDWSIQKIEYSYLNI